jgi:hypothetical protein
VNHPGVGYCVDNSLEDALLQPARPTSILPDTARTSIQIQPTNIKAFQLQTTRTTHRRLAVATCCQVAEFGQEPAACTATPMVNVEDVLTYSYEAFHSDWLDIPMDDSPYLCVLVTTKDNTQRMCLGGGGDGQDELCFEGDTALVCRPPITDSTTDPNLEIGCPHSDHLLAYNGFIGDYGLLTKGYQMRSPQGYQNSLIPSLACIQGNLQYSRFDHEACSESSQNNNQINIANDNDDPPPPRYPLLKPLTENEGLDLELIDLVGNLPDGRNKPETTAHQEDGEESSSAYNYRVVSLTSGSVLVVIVAVPFLLQFLFFVICY